VVRNQLQHVDLGCLSDPDPNLVNIFRRNPLTDVTYVSRGTNTNERDNVDLASNILTAAHIGKQRQLQVGEVQRCTLTTNFTIC
jgi:hypothetical protein